MALTLDGDNGVAGVNGSATTPAIQGTDTNTGLTFGTDTVNVVTGGTTRATVDSSGRLGIGTTSAAGNTGTRLVLHDSSSPRLRLTNSTTGETASDGGEISLDGSNLHIENRESAAIKFYNGGSERAQLDSSGNLRFNSGYGSVATAYGCRAWINFDGTGTIAIRDSGNVSSITDRGTGQYTVNFSNAMPDINYCAVPSGNPTYGGAYNSSVIIDGPGGTTGTTTSACQIHVRLSTGSNWDTSVITLAVFR